MKIYRFFIVLRFFQHKCVASYMDEFILSTETKLVEDGSCIMNIFFCVVVCEGDRNENCFELVSCRMLLTWFYAVLAK